MFAKDARLLAWVKHVRTVVPNIVDDPTNAGRFVCGGTWFCGTNLLPNASDGSVNEGPPLSCDAVEFLRTHLNFNANAWDRGQISVCLPGYPKPMQTETEAALRYRISRDGAHIDGLMAEGPSRRRHLREHHDFLLGIPLNEAGARASPFVIWEGSHRIMKDTFARALAGVPVARWKEVDLTEDYWAARRLVFETCRRIEVTGEPGEAFVVDRHVLHGIAPWGEPSSDGRSEKRIIVYFRPPLDDPGKWLAPSPT